MATSMYIYTNIQGPSLLVSVQFVAMFNYMHL